MFSNYYTNSCEPSLQQIIVSGLAETPAHRLLTARDQELQAPGPRHQALVRSPPSTQDPIPRPVRRCTRVTLAQPRPTRPRLKTRDSPLPLLMRVTRGSLSPPPPARADSPGVCRPHTWGPWGGLTILATCRSIQELHPVRTTTQICQTRDLIRSAAWPRCLSSWRGQSPPPAPPPTPSVRALTAASAPWATLSQE